MFQKWVTESPTSRSVTRLGAAYTRDAWALRGRKIAEHVDENAWEGFFGGLQQAEATLQHAATLNPSDAEPWVAMLKTARGLQMSNDDVHDRFQQAHSRQPFHPGACRQLLQTLCAKWVGTHEEMFAFARWVHEHAPADSAARDALSVAHFEFVLAEGLKPSEYFTRAEVQAELVGAAQAYLAALGALGDRAPAHHVAPLNWILLALQPMSKEAAETVLEVIAKIDGRPSAAPWDYYGGNRVARFTRTVAERRADVARFR